MKSPTPVPPPLNLESVKSYVKQANTIEVEQAALPGFTSVNINRKDYFKEKFVGNKSNASNVVSPVTSGRGENDDDSKNLNKKHESVPVEKQEKKPTGPDGKAMMRDDYLKFKKFVKKR